MPVLNALIAAAATAIMIAQAPAPRVEQVDLMSPAPQQQQQAPATQQPPPRQAQPPAAPAKPAETKNGTPPAEKPAAVPLRSEAKPSSQRIAAFWFILPGGAS